MRHECAICHRTDVRLYRIYGNFLRIEDIFCNAHLPPEPAIGWWVPLVQDTDGSVWGYMAAGVPAAAIRHWQEQPEGDPAGPSWGAER